MADTKQLQLFRNEIDAIDDEIIALLGKRMDVVRQVGQFKEKANLGRSIIRPGREAEMVRRILSENHEHFPPIPLSQIWRLIISTAINEEEDTRIATHATPFNRECYWMSREYFGSFTPTDTYPTCAEVLYAVSEKEATVGVLPIEDEAGMQAWWSRLIGMEERPYVFAKLPFIKLAPSKKPEVVCIGNVKPEKTAEDTSLWVVEVGNRLPIEILLPFIEKHNLSVERIQSCQVLGDVNVQHHLLSFDGFIAHEDQRLDACIRAARKEFANRRVEIHFHYLGSYANPIRFYQEDEE